MWWSCFIFIGLVSIGSALNLPGVPTVFTQSDEVISAISDDIARKFAHEYVNYMKTDIESAALRQISTQLAASHSKKDILTKNVAELGMVDQFFLCTSCRAVVIVLGETFRDPEGELNGENAEEDSKKVMLEICHRLDAATEEVCTGLFDLNWPYVEFIIHNTVADSRSLCGALPISFCAIEQEEFNWNVTIDANGPALEGPKGGLPEKGDNDLTILQVTDIHYDPEYAPGSLAECDEPLCCRHTPSGGVESSQEAGYWSDYRDCDTPLHLIEATFDHIAKTHTKIDFIYQTGDLVPHIVWATTQQGVIDVVTEFNDLIEKKFPNIPVYPVVGNHDSHPSNIFSPSDAPADLSVDWLYENLYTVWSKWLPADTKETILKGGYYTVLAKPGFRIIALNNNDCYLFNWWVYYDGSMGTAQLEWLHDTLLAAEESGEYVHILSHIPSGYGDCWTVWAREFNRIVVRFNHIIGGIFNGHTHVDELSVHYSPEGHAVGVEWNGGSLTSFSYKNPNYLLYEVEPTSLQVVDYETWIFDLDEANKAGAEVSPEWLMEYRFSETFTKNLSPAGMDELLEKMAEEPELLRKYWIYRGTSSASRIEEGCDDDCLLKAICRLATTVYDEKTRCNELKAKLKESLSNEPTESPPDPTKEPGGGGDGANSFAALKMTTIVALVVLIKLML